MGIQAHDKRLNISKLKHFVDFSDSNLCSNFVVILLQSLPKTINYKGKSKQLFTFEYAEHS